jgi:predicted secreted acid phosphatase
MNAFKRMTCSATMWVALLAVLSGCATSAAPPENIHFAKQRLTTYHESGRYDTDVAVVAEQAKAWLRSRAAAPGKYAVVFDIDETVLSNLPALRANDYGWILTAPCSRANDGKLSTPCGLLPWIQMGAAEPVKPVREVYLLARELGVAVFFITGRPETPEMRVATEKNLRAAGYEQWAGVLLKPTTQKLTTVQYKSGERQRITEQGYAVLASIGDQQSDLDGGFAERGFLVPNPYYFIP